MPALARERVRDGYGDISSHVQSHNVTRNTRAHQSFSRKWNLLPSSRRISAPCTQYFARPRAAIVLHAHRVRRNRARLCEDDATNPPHEGDARTKFRKCHDRLQGLTKRRYSWFDKRSPLLVIANINLLYRPLGKERGALTWNYTWGDLVTLMLAFDSHKRDLMNDDDQIPL